MKTGRLKAIPVFADLDKRDLKRIAACAGEMQVDAGEELLQEGMFAFGFFAIESGAAQVLRDGERVAELRAGDVFGEVGALSHGQRNATVVATESSTVIFVRAQDFRHFAAEMPELGERVRSLVEARTRAAGGGD